MAFGGHFFSGKKWKRRFFFLGKRGFVGTLFFGKKALWGCFFRGKKKEKGLFGRYFWGGNGKGRCEDAFFGKIVKMFFGDAFFGGKFGF